jgi:ankyrin repeat protein
MAFSWQSQGAPRGFKLNPLINPGLNTTPLSNAAENGDLGIMKLLIEHGADLELTDYKSRSTALSWAVSRGKEAAARLLLEEGANTNATNKYHETPLEYTNKTRR